MQIEIKCVSDLEALLIRLIKDGSPGNLDGVVEPETIPSLDLEGFDSLTALEILTELEEETGIHVEEDIFFVDIKAKKYRSIRETALAIWNEISKGG